MNTHLEQHRLLDRGGLGPPGHMRDQVDPLDAPVDACDGSIVIARIRCLIDTEGRRSR